MKRPQRRRRVGRVVPVVHPRVQPPSRPSTATSTSTPSPTSPPTRASALLLRPPPPGPLHPLVVLHVFSEGHPPRGLGRGVEREQVLVVGGAGGHVPPGVAVAARHAVLGAVPRHARLRICDWRANIRNMEYGIYQGGLKSECLRLETQNYLQMERSSADTTRRLCAGDAMDSWCAKGTCGGNMKGMFRTWYSPGPGSGSPLSGGGRWPMLTPPLGFVRTLWFSPGPGSSDSAAVAGPRSRADFGKRVPSAKDFLRGRCGRGRGPRSGKNGRSHASRHHHYPPQKHVRGRPITYHHPAGASNVGTVSYPHYLPVHLVVRRPWSGHHRLGRLGRRVAPLALPGELLGGHVVHSRPRNILWDRKETPIVEESKITPLEILLPQLSEHHSTAQSTKRTAQSAQHKARKKSLAPPQARGREDAWVR